MTVPSLFTSNHTSGAQGKVGARSDIPRVSVPCETHLCQPPEHIIAPLSLTAMTTPLMISKVMLCFLKLRGSGAYAIASCLAFSVIISSTSWLWSRDDEEPPTVWFSLFSLF
jgi:hypothetical protein